MGQHLPGQQRMPHCQSRQQWVAMRHEAEWTKQGASSLDRALAPSAPSLILTPCYPGSF